MGHTYDTIVVGAGASGSSLFYSLARYTNIKNCLLIEKYGKPGQVNTKASNNSQTLHTGEIETNYTIDKVRHVYPASMMVVHYVNSLPPEARPAILKTLPKMVLGVGYEEIKILEQRYNELKEFFPGLKLLYDEEVGTIEPILCKGRTERIVAIYNPEGYAVNFEKLAQSFVDEAIKYNPDARIRYNTTVVRVKRAAHGYSLLLKNGEVLECRSVVFDTDSYSLRFAKQLGYGKNFSLIPIGGIFYFSKIFLRCKVYMVQDPEMPFAREHGDPDIEKDGMTRFGPTALFYPVLESRKPGTFWDYMQSSGLEYLRTWISFLIILGNRKKFLYLMKNLLYQLPILGIRLFARTLRKMIPTMTVSDIFKAIGYGGMRLQRVDTRTHKLLLGEGKIIGENGDKLIVNMTPSPGASVALYNAYRDVKQLIKFFGDEFVFDNKKMENDLLKGAIEILPEEVLLLNGYAA